MFLGIDLGTSELKLLLLSEARRIEATASVPLALSRPEPRWSEQVPEDWWSALDAAMLQLASSHPAALRAARGIGLSGQMHGAVLLDEHAAVLRPAILWNDGRSSAECAALMRQVPELATITGNLAMPGFTAPKLRWVREHEPSIFDRVARVLLPKDYLRLRLTGEAITDCSDASGTLWLDVGRRTWSERMLDATGLGLAQMPRLVEGSEPAGRLLPELAARWGLAADIVVAGGGGDNAASAVGIGAVDPGQGFVSLGTSGVIFVVDDSFRPHPASAVHTFCHALPGRWHRMSVMLSASSCLVWAARLIGQSVAQLLALAASVDAPRRAAAPLFLPYLSGERTPHNDAAAQGVLFGLGHGHDAAAIAWSVVEGVSFGLLDGLDALALDGPGRPRSLELVGGGARSVFWSQLLADLLDIELVSREGSQTGAALGAARLGWLATGGALDEVCAPPDESVLHRYSPHRAERPSLMARYVRFRALYGTLRDTFSDQPGAAGGFKAALVLAD